MAGAGRRLLETLLFPPVRVDARRLAAAIGGRTALITGASFGIGEQVALLLARAGAHVVLVARTAEKLEALAALIALKGGQATVLAADLTQPDQISALLARVPAIDLLVSNAGKSIRRPLLESLDRPQDIARTIALNYAAPAQLVMALAPDLQANRGQVISISAANVLLAPAPYWAAYQASKAAFDGWLRSAAPELEVTGVTVTTFYLPLVRTRMIAPTAAYRDVPAMAPEQAAIRICRAVYTRRRRWRPWWLPAGELASLLLRRPWQGIARVVVRRDRARPR